MYVNVRLHSSEGLNVVTGSDDLTASLYSLETGEHVATLMHAAMAVEHVALSSRYAAVVAE